MMPTGVDLNNGTIVNPKNAATPVMNDLVNFGWE